MLRIEVSFPGNPGLQCSPVASLKFCLPFPLPPPPTPRPLSTHWASLGSTSKIHSFPLSVGGAGSPRGQSRRFGPADRRGRRRHTPGGAAAAARPAAEGGPGTGWSGPRPASLGVDRAPFFSLLSVLILSPQNPRKNPGPWRVMVWSPPSHLQPLHSKGRNPCTR